MEVSPQDPSLMAMDLSKGYSVNPLTRSHTEAMDLAKKPEWYRRPPSCGADIGSPYRSRASSSYSSQLHPEPGAPVHRRDMEQGGPESLGDYMNSTLAPALDLYRDGVHGGLWHPGFYGPDQTGGPVLESSGGEESDSGSGSDVIFLLSSSKEPLICSSFIQEDVRHIVEPLSPAASSLDEGRGCYHLPQPLSSPSPDTSDSEDSSDSSVDIPVHHTRPVVLLSDLGAVYGNAAESPVDISSDDSDVIEVSVSDGQKKSDEKNTPCKKSAGRETPPQSDEEKAPPREVRRSPRIRKPAASETPQFTCSASRHRLRRQVKNDAVGIYNESCDSDDMMNYAVRLFSSDDADESASQPNLSQRVSSNSEESDVQTDRKSPQTERQPRRKALHTKTAVGHDRKKALALCKAQRLRTKQKQNCGTATEQREKKTTKKTVRRKKRARSQNAGPCALFSPAEPEIKLKYTNLKVEKKMKKVGDFCPFVHVKKRTCTVVNYQEDEETARSSRGRQQRASGSPSGFVPNTSCFRLGRFSSDGRCQATLLCCLCGQTANAVGLGDLHGPYYPANALDWRSEQKEEERLLVSRRSVNSSDDGCDGNDAVQSLLESDGRSLPKVPLHLDEGWIHEDCSIWSAGVFLVRGKLYGLEEAARHARKTICSACQQTGAIMGCFQKGCSRNYHYRCAIQSGCVLNEDNFSMRCPEHKNKLLTSATRQHKR